MLIYRTTQKVRMYVLYIAWYTESIRTPTVYTILYIWCILWGHTYLITRNTITHITLTTLSISLACLIGETRKKVLEEKEGEYQCHACTHAHTHARTHARTPENSSNSSHTEEHSKYCQLDPHKYNSLHHNIRKALSIHHPFTHTVHVGANLWVECDEERNLYARVNNSRKIYSEHNVM